MMTLDQHTRQGYREKSELQKGTNTKFDTDE